MKNFPLSALLFGIHFMLITTLSAQVDFFPSGAEWYYGFNASGLLAVRGYTHFKYSGDIKLAGRNAKILERTIYYFDYDHPTVPTDTVVNSPIYLAQSVDSILIYNGAGFQLLWRTALVSGDSYEVVRDIFTYTMSIANVEPEMFGTHEVKKIWVEGSSQYGQGGEAIIYDQFGPANGFDYFHCWGYYDCYDATLCRYESDVTGRIDFGAQECDLLSTATKEVRIKPVAVYPNPFEDVFTVEAGQDGYKDVKVEIYTTTGQLMYAKNFNNEKSIEVDLTGRVSGVFVGKLINGGIVRVFRIVKD